MAWDRPANGFGWRVFGLGIVAIALVNLHLGTFDPAEPVPKTFPDRAVLSTVCSGFLLIAGLAIQWRRITAYAAAALTIYYALIVVVLMDGRVILKHLAEYGAYSGAAEVLALAASGLIIYAASARIDAQRAARLTRVGQIVFGVCAILFGGAHFFYMNMTAPLVPKWLPPSGVFWGYLTGVAHIAAGVAIITGVQARLAAILLTVMYASFTLLVHGPLVIGNPASDFFWTENALNLALIGAAWAVADSTRKPRL